jgi:hypothetical protein
VADLFDMQGQIVARLASQLGAQLIEAEARRAERSPDPGSMDLYFRAKALINRGSTVLADFLRGPRQARDRPCVSALTGGVVGCCRSAIVKSFGRRLAYESL